MKTQLHFKPSIIFLALVFWASVSFAQDFEISKTLNKSETVAEGVVVDVSNHSGDIKFTISNNNTITIKTEINIDAKNEEDAKKLMKAINDFKFELQGNRLTIDTRFYKNMNSINGQVINLTLINGDKLKLKDFTISHEISMPASAKLRLENKYSNVSFPNLQGETQLNLYSSKLNAADFNSDLEIEAKYSKIYVGNIKGETSLELYDTNMEFENAASFDADCKYSSIEGNKTGNLNLVSYDDKFLINEFSNLKMEAKYSDFNSKSEAGEVVLDLYDCNLSISAAKRLKFSGKYSELKLGNVKTLEIGESHDNDIYLKHTQLITINESKYSSYSLSSASKFDISGYDDEVVIDRLNDNFEGISFDCKYGKLRLNSSSKPFQMDLAMKYGKVNLPDSFAPTTHIEKDSELEIKGGINGGTIYIRGYDNQIDIR